MSAMNAKGGLLRRLCAKLRRGATPQAGPVITINEVCAALQARGGLNGSQDEFVTHVRLFFRQMAEHLRGDFKADTGYFCVYPMHGKKPPLRRLPQSIVLEVEERTEKGCIEYFTDMDTRMVNERVTPGAIFVVTGHELKIEGDQNECGVWFVSKADPSRRFKVTRGLAENSSMRVSGIVPVMPADKYIIEIRTQYCEGAVIPTEPRTLTSSFILRNYQLLKPHEDEE